jgi:hypothetical protein
MTSVPIDVAEAQRRLDYFLSRAVLQGECLVWTGAVSKRGGYPKASINKRFVYVHRVVWVAVHSTPIPEGMEVDHVKAKGCTSRACIKPEHLELVTGAENNLRSDSMSARRQRQTHCVRGHPFTEANTYRWRTRRYCRACRAL